MLKRVQKRATKILSQHRHLTYTDRLTVYKLPTLHYRQIRGDMIEVYKIITGKYEGSYREVRRDVRRTGPVPAMKSEATAIFAPQDGRWKITVSFDGRRFCVPKFRH